MVIPETVSVNIEERNRGDCAGIDLTLKGDAYKCTPINLTPRMNWPSMGTVYPKVPEVKYTRDIPME